MISLGIPTFALRTGFNHSPPKSPKEGPYFLGVLRVLDIPDALGLLAPRKLTIIGGRDPVFDRTEEIYRRAGAADKLIRK